MAEINPPRKITTVEVEVEASAEAEGGEGGGVAAVQEGLAKVGVGGGGAKEENEIPLSLTSSVPISTALTKDTLPQQHSLKKASSKKRQSGGSGPRLPPPSSLPSHTSSPLEQQKLLPLHKDVGERNRELVEPLTPDFKPTPDWVSSWKQKLPLHTVLRVLQVLVPQVEKLCTEHNVKSEAEILSYLKNGTLVGLLPVPHPILIRKYQTSESTEMWLHSYIWGVVYVRNYDPPIWYDTSIKLFHVHKQSGPETVEEDQTSEQ